MPISVTCSNGHKINAPEKYAGKVVKCPKCNVSVKIPNATKNATSERHNSNVVATADPVSVFSSDFGGTDNGTDPFGDLSDLPDPTYSLQSNPPASHPMSDGAGYLQSTVSRGTDAVVRGKKPPTTFTAERKSIPLFALIGGGAALVVALIVFVGVLFVLTRSDSTSSSKNSLASNSAEAASKEFEIAKAHLIAKFHPEGVPEGERGEEFKKILKSLQELSSPKAAIYFGYDSTMRAKMRDYMISRGTSQGDATLIALQVAAGVRMRGTELGISPDVNGNYPIPESQPNFRQTVLDTEIDESVGISPVTELQPLLKGLREKTLSPEETELAFFLKLNSARY